MATTFVDKTIDVTVSLETAPVAQQSFTNALALVPHNLSANTVDSFTSLKSVQDFGAATNSPLYHFASGVFGGKQPISILKVGAMQQNGIEITVDTIPAEGEVVSIYVKVEGIEKTVSFTVPASATTSTVAAGLAAAIEVAFPTTDSGVTANKITFSSPAQDKISVGWGSTNTATKRPHCIIKGLTADTPTDVLAQVQTEDSDFFYVLAESHVPSEVEALGTAVNALDAIYLTSTSDENVKNSANSSNIAVTLADKAQSGVCLTYSKVADTYFTEAYTLGAWGGTEASASTTLNLNTLEGVPVDNLSTQERITLTQRNTNYYHKERGENVFKEGWVMSSDFIDTVRFSKWLKIRSEEALFGLFKRKANRGTGVPYSDFGSLMMKNTILTDVVNVGIRNGGIATGVTIDELNGTIDLNPVVEFGTRAAQTTNNIASRIWDNGLIEVVYISPIHHVKVRAYVIGNRPPQ